jgi:hypothetical protein
MTWRRRRRRRRRRRSFITNSVNAWKAWHKLNSAVFSRQYVDMSEAMVL